MGGGAVRRGIRESQISELKGPWKASPTLTSPLSKMRGLQSLLCRSSAGADAWDPRLRALLFGPQTSSCGKAS